MITITLFLFRTSMCFCIKQWWKPWLVVILRLLPTTWELQWTNWPEFTRHPKKLDMHGNLRLLITITFYDSLIYWSNRRNSVSPVFDELWVEKKCGKSPSWVFDMASNLKLTLGRKRTNILNIAIISSDTRIQTIAVVIPFV